MNFWLLYETFDAENNMLRYVTTKYELCVSEYWGRQPLFQYEEWAELREDCAGKDAEDLEPFVAENNIYSISRPMKTDCK